MLKLDVIKTLEDLKNSKIVEIEADLNHRFKVNYDDIVNFEKDEVLDAGGITMLLCLLFCWLIIPGIILAIWWIIDIFLLLTGGLKPKDGSLLV